MYCSVTGGVQNAYMCRYACQGNTCMYGNSVTLILYAHYKPPSTNKVSHCMVRSLCAALFCLEVHTATMP